MAGRQPKLNKILINKICKYIEKGMSRKNTCKRVGISEVTFYQWINEAEMINKALEVGKTLEEPMIIEIGEKSFTITNCLLKTELTESIHIAESKYIEKYVDVIETAVKGNDIATAKWVLERRDRETFGLQQTVKIGNMDGETFKQEVHVKSREERFLEFKLKLDGLKLGNLKKPEVEQTEE